MPMLQRRAGVAYGVTVRQGVQRFKRVKKMLVRTVSRRGQMAQSHGREARIK